MNEKQQKEINSESGISSKIKFKDINDYLYSHSCFGFIATRRKKVIIYSFKRYYTKLELSLKVKVDRSTKEVISVMHNGNVYTDFEDIKEIVENYGVYKK